MQIPFGNHQGKEIDSLPTDYLRWLSCEDWFERKYPELLEEINEELLMRDHQGTHFYDD